MFKIGVVTLSAHPLECTLHGAIASSIWVPKSLSTWGKSSTYTKLCLVGKFMA